jgi:glycerol-3-phosphate acyltransferase PlsX
MFLGLQGVCVTSHGGTDPEGFANAIGVAYDLVERRFNKRICEELARHYGHAEELEGKAHALPSSEAESA